MLQLARTMQEEALQQQQQGQHSQQQQQQQQQQDGQQLNPGSRQPQQHAPDGLHERGVQQQLQGRSSASEMSEGVTVPVRLAIPDPAGRGYVAAQGGMPHALVPASLPTAEHRSAAPGADARGTETTAGAAADGGPGTTAAAAAAETQALQQQEGACSQQQQQQGACPQQQQQQQQLQGLMPGDASVDGQHLWLWGRWIHITVRASAIVVSSLFVLAQASV
eukprot:1157119-Pelagomonas_calceolata.AAC.10